jgi:predicted nucleic acid-binding protein
MPFVLDASVTACWAFPDEGHPNADLALNRMRTEEALVPSLWWFEIRNILVVNERRLRLTETESATFLLNLSRLPFSFDRDPDNNEVLRLARAHRLSVYDAAYLELARRSGVALATLDAALIRSARAETVPLIEDR